MITITHEKATFTVKSENAEPTRELLALIDKSKGRKGRKLKKSTPARRQYPAFTPGMRTADYVRQYTALNTPMVPVTYTHADRPAAMYDPTQPEVVELPCEP
jgi:hypothetical protein